MTRMNARSIALLAAVTALVGVLACTDDTSAPKPADLNKVGHVVVIYLENRSFDNTYGEFPGADGLASAASALPQDFAQAVAAFEGALVRRALSECGGSQGEAAARLGLGYHQFRRLLRKYAG